MLSAENAEAAIELARTAQPSMILMDIQLPGMDGLEATRILKADASTRHIPVVALTAFAMKEDEARSLRAGCASHMSKPIDVRTFVETLRAQLQR